MKTVLLVDGGYLRACSKSAGLVYDNAFIEKFCPHCFTADEYAFRYYYYDAAQFRGRVKLPVSGNQTAFSSSDQWLNDLAELERFAVRRGTVGFRGWQPKVIPLQPAAPLTDADFKPIFEQKGVDMRIGLDIATFSEVGAVDRILLVSGDTDMIPAMKHARKAGLEIGIIQIPARALHQNLKAHADFVRVVAWP